MNWIQLKNVLLDTIKNFELYDNLANQQLKKLIIVSIYV